MKKTFGLALIALCLASCNSEKRKVDNVARHYLEATSAYDIEESCKYCTPQTAQSLITIKENILPNVDSAFIAENSKAKIKISKTEFTSDTSANVLFEKRTPSALYHDTLLVVKRDGQWMARVDFRIPPILMKREHHFTYDTTKTFHALKPAI